MFLNSPVSRDVQVMGGLEKVLTSNAVQRVEDHWVVS